MHTYDSPRRLPYTSPIPAMRPAPDSTGSHSATPIYDALYAEFRRSFRALPGDRSGEEELGFTAFGPVQHATGRLATHSRSTTATWQPVARQHASGLIPALPPGSRRER
ncbi:hypothetical protein G5C60_33865 [Streptomyces sp. HC44]|uniref:Uncharacterized protein n=1 Tax=Streptomyces scabichelini TaxID=2711217 RepID=A0A6G4VF79_9ACTN|nr:hypothetical protein [Streptomyces scabichelini]